jgi:hypothetical protein
MQVFEDLASDIHRGWTRFGRDELAFPNLCQSMLERFPALAVSPEDVIRWLLTTENLPTQSDPDSKFGNVALTVATRDDFFIQVLIWTDSTTGIHQHGFSGAFLVLHGSSLHSLWSFRECRRWSDRLKAGQLTLSTTEYLRTGSVRPILPSAEMIHSLFHLDSPSVTVVVRTPVSAVFIPQLSYARSGLAYDPRVELARTEKLSQLLRMLWTSNHPLHVPASEAAMSTVDVYSAVRIIFSLRSRPEAQASLLDMLSARDSELAALLRETVARLERDRSILRLRKQTSSPRHRTLLALVLNLPDRSSIESVLRQIAPEEDPAEWLWDTIRSMHATPAERAGGRSVLGLPLNEPSEEALRLLISGHSVDEVACAVVGPNEQLPDVDALRSSVAASPVLASLLQRR